MVSLDHPFLFENRFRTGFTNLSQHLCPRTGVIASGGGLPSLGAGRRQIRSVPVSGKLSSLGPYWPEVGAVWMGRPFLMERRDDLWLPQLCYSAMRAKAKRLLRQSEIVWTMARTRRKQKAESISPLMNVIRPPWRTSSFWQRPAMPL